MFYLLNRKIYLFVICWCLSALAFAGDLRPNSHIYFDYPQDPQNAAPGEHVITTETVRSFRIPVAPHVLGVQANLWTEHIRTPEQLFHMAFPRAEVLAEKFIPQSAAVVTDRPGE